MEVKISALEEEQRDQQCSADDFSALPHVFRPPPPPPSQFSSLPEVGKAAVAAQEPFAVPMKLGAENAKRKVSDGRKVTDDI